MSGEEPAARELRRFIYVKPVLDYSALEPGAAATHVIRTTVQTLGLVQDQGVPVRLTGPVPMADEEFATIADGAMLNGALTIAAVILILWLALRSSSNHPRCSSKPHRWAHYNGRSWPRDGGRTKPHLGRVRGAIRRHRG